MFKIICQEILKFNLKNKSKKINGVFEKNT